MTNLWRWHAKSLLTNSFLWFWGVVFMLFWIVIGAFVESHGQSIQGPGVLMYTAAWYSIIVLLSLSMLSAAIASSLTHSTSALAYAFRFTRIGPSGYLLSLVGGSATIGIALGCVMLGGTIVLFGARFGNIVLPSNLPALVGVCLAAGVFMMLLAVVLILLVVNHFGLRSTSFVGFVPLVLSYGLGLVQIYAAVPAVVVYASPYNDIYSLLFQAFTGAATPVTVSGGGTATLDWPLLLLGLGVWMGILVASAIYLLGHIRPRQVEEGRQV